jgi:hypothetical protein
MQVPMHSIWKEGREGSKRLVEYVRKIGFFHRIKKIRRSKKRKCKMKKIFYL